MEKIVIGLAGEMASGKGTIAAYLNENCGGSTHRFSTILRDVAARMYLEENRENLQKISTLFRQNFSEDILSKVIFKDVENDASAVVAVDGVRRFSDIVYLKQMPNFRLIYVEAGMEKRFERIIKREENVDDAGKTFEQFKKEQAQEAESQISALRAGADFVVDNNGTLEDLHAQIDRIIEKCKE
ncbi:MAG: AAA family ATPase [Parcubacteria group bacterium]|jgi:dephospho-CoA kinase